MRKRMIVFVAVYMVFAQGLILLMVSLMEENMKESVGIFLSGAIILGIALLCVKILKRIFKIHRPAEQGKLFVPLDSYAFPSGHATGLSAMTVFIFEKNIELGLASLLLACIVISARIYSQVHDYIDIVGGVILGGSIAYFLSSTVEQFVSNILLTHMFL